MAEREGYSDGLWGLAARASAGSAPQTPGRHATRLCPTGACLSRVRRRDSRSGRRNDGRSCTTVRERARYPRPLLPPGGKRLLLWPGGLLCGDHSRPSVITQHAAASCSVLSLHIDDHTWRSLCWEQVMVELGYGEEARSWWSRERSEQYKVSHLRLCRREGGA